MDSDTEDFHTALKNAVDKLLEAASWLDCCSALAEEDEPGYYKTHAEKVRRYSEKMLPPGDCFPGNVIAFVPRMRG